LKEDDIWVLVLHRLKQAETTLEDARYLLDGHRSPQSIINRSYYAMFYAVLALLQKSGRVPSKHTGAVSLFDTEFVSKGLFSKELSRELHRAFELRQISDYKTLDSPPFEKAEEIWKKAADFIASVKEYLNPDI